MILKVRLESSNILYIIINYKLIKLNIDLDDEPTPGSSLSAYLSSDRDDSNSNWGSSFDDNEGKTGHFRCTKHNN